MACQRVHLRCIRLLTSAGADRSVKDDRGFTPIDVLHEFPGTGEDGGEEEDAEVDAEPEDAGATEPRLSAQPPPQLSPQAHGQAAPQPHGSPHPALDSSVRTDAGPRLIDDLGVFNALDPPLKKLVLSPTPPRAAPQRTTSADTRLLEAIVWLKKEGAGNFMTGSALHTAVTTGCLKVVETLLSVDPSSACAINAKGETPVHSAIEARNIDALRLLVGSWAKFCNRWIRPCHLYLLMS